MSAIARPICSSPSDRRGVLAAELFFILPVLLIATVAVIQFGTTLTVEQAVTHAATVAAREAAKGASLTTLAGDVDEILAVHGLAVGADVSVVLEDPSAAMPVQQSGTLPCTPPAAPTLDSDEVRVTICLNLTAPPLLNVLATLGIDFTGDVFTVSSMAKKE